MVERTEGRRLGDLPLLAGWRVLALGQPVDLVVAHEDLDVDVAAEGMDQMVPSNGQRVAVTRDDPHREVRPRRRQPAGDRGSPPVDAVDTVRVHVVHEPARASDPRDEHDLLRRDPELREKPLDGGKDRVVAASRAPPNFLVAGEVLLGQGPDDSSSGGYARLRLAA